MEKVAFIVVGVLALAGSANAQVLSNEYGSWYTNQAQWLDLVTNASISTATYDRSDATANTGDPYVDNGVSATPSANVYLVTSGGTLLVNPVTTSLNFTFSGNSFFGEFRTSRDGSLNFSIDGSLTNTYSLSTLQRSSRFLGYISKSSSPISVKVSAGTSTSSIRVNTFSFGQSKSSLGGNVAPEPGTLALSLTSGCALVGMVIRRRRMSN